MNLWVENCNGCGLKIGVDLGDLQDVTGVDIDGMECPQCGIVVYQEGFDIRDCFGEPNVEVGEPLSYFS